MIDVLSPGITPHRAGGAYITHILIDVLSISVLSDLYIQQYLYAWREYDECYILHQTVRIDGAGLFCH